MFKHLFKHLFKHVFKHVFKHLFKHLLSICLSIFKQIPRDWGPNRMRLRALAELSTEESAASIY